MRTHSPLFLLTALGVLSAAGMAAAADTTTVDTSEWKCESCPFPKKGSSGAIDVGLAAVSDTSAKFGDYTGLQRRGAYLALGGELSQRSESGYYAQLLANDLGLGSRSLDAQSGREGLYALRLGYSEMPRHLSDGALTPFLGNGGAVLTLPPGFPAAGTSTMPLASALQPVALGLTFKRLELGGSWLGMANWTYRINLRHDVRDGTRALSGAFFAAAAQLAAPVDQVTDQLELSASYVTRQLQLTLGYHASLFRNGAPALTWADPFWPVVSGAIRGQLALAPDNQSHRIVGSAGYEITPKIRASADFAIGRMTQDAAYLAATLTPGLAALLPALPNVSLASLNGRVDTFNGSVRVSAAASDKLRLNASYARDVRDNRTPVRSYPAVSTDIFVGPVPRSNEAFGLTQDRFKINADYRAPASLKLSAGVEQDYRQRSYQEVVTTREATVWGRASMQPREDLALALKLAHAERRHSTYGTSVWTETPDNPLLRKYYLAARQRDSAGARADLTLSEKVSIGLAVDYANDDYTQSTIGLTAARSASVAADISVALSDKTQLQLFAQAERIRSRQAGSQAYAAPDWNAQNKDRFEVVGLSVKHNAIVDKLDLGAELTFTRSRSDIVMQTAASDLSDPSKLTGPQFPSMTTALDSVKLYATYKLSGDLSVTGSYWYEAYRSQDWHLDGVLPASVQNLLSFGLQAPHYRVGALRVSLRYRF